MVINSIAFIPDGNRRYAKKVGINLVEAYNLGTIKAWDVLNWMSKYPSIKSGTFYTLSLENLSRGKCELSALFKIFEKELDKIKENDIFPKYGLKLNFLGRLNLFPKKLQEKMKNAQDYTAKFGNERTINLAMGYNGQAEIVDGVKKILDDYKKGIISDKQLTNFSQNDFSNYLYDSASPDLIIRTSGTQRLSGFLTYQSAYSELYFLDKYWPEFSKADLDKAIYEYNSRDRRFGK